MRILGIDPGSRVTGWGVIDATGWDIQFVAHGVLRLPATASLEARLCALARGLEGVVRERQPEVVAVEEIFHAQHARAALVLGHARGVALLIVGQSNLPLFEYAPARVKRCVTGSGSAEKEQVQRALATQLGMRELPTPLDASDALAVALCHAAEARLGRHVAALAEAESPRPRSRRRVVRA